MAALKKRRLLTVLVALSIAIASVGIGVGLAQETPSPPAELAITSVFPEDICAPPCWFGITPGESTSLDVERMFEQQQILFTWRCMECERRADGLVLDGFFRFRWRFYPRSPDGHPLFDLNAQWPSEIYLDSNSVVRAIYMQANRDITLADTLAALGEPDDIYLSSGVANDLGEINTLLLMRYIQRRLKVSLITYPLPTCDAQTVVEDFHLDRLTYYSIEYAAQLISVHMENGEDSLKYPRLVFPYVGDGARQLRGASWEQFLDGEGYEQCEDLLASLPATYIVPTLPWASPPDAPAES